MKTSTSSPLLCSLQFSCAALLSGLAAHALAAPEGSAIRGGAGTITNAGDITTVEQNSQRLAIDWQSFDVGANETVNFVQPSADALALNRILSNDASQIMGRINANGTVLLVNPNGIFFGSDAEVNVGSLVASGLDIDADAFMAGDVELRAEGTGRVSNSGLINASAGGDVVLLGNSVGAGGRITAHWGNVTLAAGRAAILTFDPEQRIGVKVAQVSSRAEEDGAVAISVSGRIVAKGGNVLITAKESQDLFSSAVNAGDMAGAAGAVVHDDGSFSLGRAADIVIAGSIRHGSVNGSVDVAPVVPANPDQPKEISTIIEGRDITLIGDEDVIRPGDASGMASVGGTAHLGYTSRTELKATGVLEVGAYAYVRAEGDDGWQDPAAATAGGSIVMTGREVDIGENAWILTSGQSGGSIKIGDENTERVQIGEYARLYARALSNPGRTIGGDGGTIDIHSSLSTQVEGIFSTIGGLNGDSGGNVTVSSGGDLGFNPSDMSLGSGGSIGYTSRYPGRLTLSAPNLVLGRSGDDPNFIYMLQEPAWRHSVHLKASESITVGSNSIGGGLAPFDLTMTAKGSDGRAATIDLTGLKLYSADWRYGATSARIEADGDIIAPQIGLQQLSDWADVVLYTNQVPAGETLQFHPVTLTITSHGGDIIHRHPAYLYEGSYTANAAGDIRFANSARLRTWEHSDIGSGGSVKFNAGGNIDLNLDAIVPVNNPAPPTIALKGDHVRITAVRDIPSASVKAERLTVSANGTVQLKADICNITQLSGGANSLWSVSGNFNRVDAALADGSSMALQDRNSVVLGGWSLMNAAAQVTANGTISQRSGSLINLGSAQLSLTGDNIHLGAGGSAGLIMGESGNSLTANFKKNLRLSGEIESCATDNQLSFVGSKLDNGVTINDTATITLAPEQALAFRLGNGADNFSVATTGKFQVSLGDGPDTVEIGNPTATVALTDFDSQEDMMITPAP